ncbi:MAG: glycosyltransferase [Planctomycetia bacterium]
MPTVFWSGTFDRCGRRVLSRMEAAMESATPATEVIFVFDGAAPPAPAWLDRPGVTVVKTGTRSGPSAARNAAARAASGRILLFVDADVELAADALDRIHAAFESDPDLVALFGTYDDEPPGLSVTSNFRNLLHHHTHASHPGEASTFWSGCGAIRAAEFHDLGGFDDTYDRPCIEDIELGMRIAGNGGRIVLDPGLRCKHLKQWTLTSMVFTDVVHRATPWTRLIVTSGRMPGTLNLDWRGRMSGILSIAVLASVAVTPFAPSMAWVSLVCGLTVVGLNLDFYRLCAEKRGLGFAISAIALHWLYFAYSSITFGVVAAHECWLRLSRPSERRHPAPAK